MIFAAKSREVFAVSFSKNSCYDIIFFSVVNDFFKCFSKKFFNPFAPFCMLVSYARARAHSCVFIDTRVELHALNRFTKSYKIIFDCSDWGIDTLF